MRLVAIKRHPGVDADAIASAINTQVRDLAAAWNTGDVTVVAYGKPGTPARKPRGAARVQFYDSLPPGMGGVHLGTAKNPYAKVLVSEGSVAASHEVLEMLVDPDGTRFQQVGIREYLVEVCDPCEADWYVVNGVPVSDFITPAYYASVSVPRTHLDVIHQQCGLEPGGYVSFIENGDWFQSFCDSQGRVTTHNLGTATLRTRAEKDELAARFDAS